MADYIALTKVARCAAPSATSLRQQPLHGRGVDAALITAGRRWPLGPVGMDFLERLRVVGASFVIFDLDRDNAALAPLGSDPNDVRDIGNARSVGGFTRNAYEHVRRTLMHDAKSI